jgi:hypothetical protein
MKIDYSKMDEEYPYAAVSYGKQREANGALVLSVAKALTGVGVKVTAVEPRGPYGTAYNVIATGQGGCPGITLYFLLEYKGKTVRLSVNPNYIGLGLSVQAHELKDRKADKATFDLSRDPVKIAKEIVRRVVEPYEYNRLGMIRDHKERQYAAGKRDATVERLVKILGGSVHRDGGGKFTDFADVGAQETLSVYCPSGVTGHRFSVTPGGYTTVERVTFSDPDKAVKLAEFLIYLKDAA